MNKICSLTVTFLLLFPCLLFAKYMAVLETLSPKDLLTMQERLYLTDILRGQAVQILPAEQNWTIMTRENINVMLPPGKKIEDCEGSCLAETGKNIAADYVAQARISQFGKSLAITAELYETASSKLVASFVGKGESVEDLEKIVKEQSPDFFKKARDLNERKSDTTKAVVATAEETTPKAEETSLKAENAYAELDGKKQALDKPKAETVKASEQAADSSKPKQIWGGITAGVLYNDFYSSKFGLDNIKHDAAYNASSGGADDLLKNYWGVGFKVGMGLMFMQSQYFNLRGDLNLAFRQGTGESNVAVTLTNKDTGKSKKSDMKIEYSVTQLNIDLPLLARISPSSAFYIEAGPMFSFNVYSKSKAKITDIFGTQTYKDNGGLSAFEFDIATGIGVTRNVGKSILDFDLRMVFGMTRISDSKSSPKTWQGQLSITYWFL